MFIKNLFIFLLITLCWKVQAQTHRYPVEDFHHRIITIPIDHTNKQAGNFQLYYELSTNFNFEQPTIFFITDQQQSYGKAGKVDKLHKDYLFDPEFNLVFIENRGRQYSYIETYKEDGSIDWEKVYYLLSSKQMIEDIECIRRDLFKDHPQSKVYIFARSGGGYVAQEYLAKYGKHIQRVYLQCAPNPIIMKQLGFLESKSLINALNAADSSLHDKLRTVLESKIVPELHLLWMLFRIRYTVQSPDSIYSTLINGLSNNDTSSYQEFIKKGFDYSKVKGAQTAMWKQMGLGIVMSPLQCDGYYFLGDPPDYVDPVYTCLGDLSAPVIQLVRQNKVLPPQPPSLEQFRNIETAVFYQAGYHDHITPYQVGIELGKYFKHYELYIADDDHMMKKYKDCYPELRNAFFKYGIESEELKDVRNSIQCQEWLGE